MPKGDQFPRKAIPNGANVQINWIQNSEYRTRSLVKQRAITPWRSTTIPHIVVFIKIHRYLMSLIQYTRSRPACVHTEFVQPFYAGRRYLEIFTSGIYFEKRWSRRVSWPGCLNGGQNIFRGR